MSLRSKSHQVDWFRHDSPASSPAPAPASYEPASFGFGGGHESSESSRGPVSLHSAEFRNVLDAQIAERKQINDFLRQQDHQSTLASLQHEQQLIEQEKRHAALTAQEKRLRLKMDLDEQMAAKQLAKQRDRDEAARTFQEQQESLLKWQREQEEDKIRKQAQSNQLALQRRVQLAEAETNRKMQHAKRRDEERQQLSLYSAQLEEQDSSRKRVFMQTAASQFLSNDTPPASHRSARGAASSPFVPAQNTLSGYQTEMAKPQDRTSLCRDLLVQMEDKKRRVAAEKEADRAYAQYMLHSAQSAKEEEEQRKRAVLEKNSLFRSYLEQQMTEKRSGSHQSPQSNIYASNVEAPSSLLATRPW